MKRYYLTFVMLVGAVVAMAQFQQVPLKYKYSDLEPYIDSTTMRIHYSLHHATYAKNLNKALEKYPDYQNMPLLMLLKDIKALPADVQTTVRNNGGGVYNHNLFFDELTKPSLSIMPDGFKQVLVQQYGSVEAFKAAMEKAALSQFGSGWAWLMVSPSGKLSIINTPNQDAPIMDATTGDGVPIMNIDVWEHAYYLKYQNKRAEYLKNFWNVVDWGYVYNSYLKVVGK